MVPTNPLSLAAKIYPRFFFKNLHIGATMEDFPDNWDVAEYYKWAKVDRKVKKVVQSVDVEEAIELFNGKNFGSA